MISQAAGGHWFHVWLLLAGRGFGQDQDGDQNIARMIGGSDAADRRPGRAGCDEFVADNAADMRRFSIEGVAGLLDLGRLLVPGRSFILASAAGSSTGPTAARRCSFSAEDPDSTRGSSRIIFLVGRLAKAKRRPGLVEICCSGCERAAPKGTHHDAEADRPDPAADESGLTHITRGSTWDNKANFERGLLSRGRRAAARHAHWAAGDRRRSDRRSAGRVVDQGDDRQGARAGQLPEGMRGSWWL